MRIFYERCRDLSLVFRKLETCGKPFAAAINGVCMGGGFELALACHYRIVADSDKARVGLPEIKVGLFPGGGGTQRVARLMPTPDALQMLFKGDQICPAVAKKMGLVHDVAPRGRDRRQGEGMGEGQSGRQGAVGREEFRAALGQGVLAGGHADLAAGQRDLPPRNLRQLPGRAGDPLGVLRGPATADGPRARGRKPLFREDPALEGGGGDDPLAVPVDGRVEQGRAPSGRRSRDQAAQDRGARRRIHGRRRRLCLGERRARGGARSTEIRNPQTRARPIRRNSSRRRSPRAAPRAPTATRCSRASRRPQTMPR